MIEAFVVFAVCLFLVLRLESSEACLEDALPPRYSRAHKERLQHSLLQSGSDPSFYSFKFYYPAGTVLIHSFIIHFFITYSFILSLYKLSPSQNAVVTWTHYKL